MFRLHALMHPSRQYLQSGDFDPLTVSICPWLPSPVETVFGPIPEDIDIHCAEIAVLDHAREEHHSEIDKHLRFLSQVDLSDDKLLVLASVLSFRIKFGYYRNCLPNPTSEEAKATYKFITKNVSRTWQAFYRIFEFCALFPHPDVNFFPKYISRFVHFYQVYHEIAKHTQRNSDRNVKMIAILLSGLIKYLSSVPPDQIGHCYTAPKMMRELVLSMKELFPWDERLTKPLLGILAASYDYLNSLSVQESKRELINFLFSFQRQMLDDAVEGKNTLGKVMSEDREAFLLADLARCGLVNEFGTVSGTPAYMDKGILHLKLIVANELHGGHFLVMVHRGQIASKHVVGERHELVETINKARKMARDGECGALEVFKRVAAMLDLYEFGEDLKNFMQGVRLRRIYIYPDGYLWNLPWSFLMDDVWEKKWRQNIPDGQPQAAPPVAVKLGGRPVNTTKYATRARFLAGWRYQRQSYTSASRRGERLGSLFENLPAAREEVYRLKDKWHPFRADVGDTLTASRLVEIVNSIEDNTIVHVACHGDAGDSGIPTLWLPGSERPEEYTALHYERALRASWRKCELTFFNACFGGSGEPHIGGPTLGLQEALSIAGCRRMIAPLWPILDQVAMEFAINFYYTIKDCNDYVDAFALTRRTLSHRNDPNTQLTLAAYGIFLL